MSAAVSRPAGWACRPRLGVRVGRRQVPCRPAPRAVTAGARYTVSAAEGLCRTAALESAAGLLCRTAGRLAQGCPMRVQGFNFFNPIGLFNNY